MFLDASNIPDGESQYIKRSDCDTLFIVSNYIADKKAPEAKVHGADACLIARPLVLARVRWRSSWFDEDRN